MAYSLGPTIVKDGLVFAFDAANPRSYPGSGNNIWYNLVGNNISASFYAEPQFGSYNGGSLNFDGADDAAIATIGGRVEDFSEFTLNAWIRLASSTTTGNHSAVGALFNAFGLGVFNYKLIFNVNQFLRVGVAVLSPETLQTGSWYMLSGVFGQSTLTAYLNGNFSASTSSYISQSNPPSQFSDVWIGTGFRFGVQLFRGDIAQVQLYSRPLSPSEVLQNYKASKGRYGLK